MAARPRQRRATLWSIALAATVAACGTDPTLVTLTVRAPDALGNRITTLRTTLTSPQRAPLAEDVVVDGFPRVINIGPSADVTELDVFIEGLDVNAIPRATAATSVAVVRDDRVDVELTLSASDFPIGDGAVNELAVTVPGGGFGGDRLAVFGDENTIVFGSVAPPECGSVINCVSRNRLFDPTGDPVAGGNPSSTDAFTVANTSQPPDLVLAGNDSSYIATWVTSAGIDVLLPNSGEAGSTPVPTTGTGHLSPSAAAIGGSLYAVAWTQTVDAERELWGSLVDVSMPTVGVPFRINDVGEPASEPVVARRNDGAGFIVGWVRKVGNTHELRVASFDGEGVPVFGGDTVLTLEQPGTISGLDLLSDESGAIIAAWAVADPPTVEYRMARFNIATGSPETAEVVISDNVKKAGLQTGVPALAWVNVGAVLVVGWDNCGVLGDGDGCGVYYRRYANGAEITANEAPQRANTTTSGDQVTPSVGVIVDTPARLVMSWTSQTALDTTVRARIITLP